MSTTGCDASMTSGSKSLSESSPISVSPGSVFTDTSSSSRSRLICGGGDDAESSNWASESFNSANVMKGEIVIKGKMDGLTDRRINGHTVCVE